MGMYVSNLGPTPPTPVHNATAPMKLKLAEGVYNHMEWAIGQLLAPRGFG